MPDSMSESMNCPVCLETMSPPIKQCEKGHSTCGTCVMSNHLQTCPLCRSPMTEARNYQLEELISKLKDVTLSSPCDFASSGCKYILKMDEKESHQLECKNRVYKCEGKKFCGWNCDWSGKYEEIVQHFKIDHQRLMEFKTENCIKIDFTETFTDVQAIDYQNGQQIFWYKYKVDSKAEKVYWLIQYVGLRKQAAQYYYEFEVWEGATRKLKVTEICESDCKDAHMICSEDRCAAISFKTTKSFLNAKGELSFRFRVMKIKPINPGPTANPVTIPKSRHTDTGRPSSAPNPVTIPKPRFTNTAYSSRFTPPSPIPLNVGAIHMPMTRYNTSALHNNFLGPALHSSLLGPAPVQRSISVPNQSKPILTRASQVSKPKYKNKRSK